MDQRARRSYPRSPDNFSGRTRAETQTSNARLAMHLTRNMRVRFNAVYESVLKDPTWMKEDTGV